MHLPFNNSQKYHRPRQVCFLNAEQALLIHLRYSCLMQKSRVRGCERISPGICVQQPKTDVNYFPPQALARCQVKDVERDAAVSLCFPLCCSKDSKGRCELVLFNRDTILLEQNSVGPKNLAYLLHMSFSRGDFSCFLVQTAHEAEQSMAEIRGSTSLPFFHPAGLSEPKTDVLEYNRVLAL